MLTANMKECVRGVREYFSFVLSRSFLSVLSVGIHINERKKNIYLYCWGSLLGENKNQNKFTTRDTENIQCVDISHIEFPFQ